MALTHRIASGPGPRAKTANIVLPEGAQDPYPFLWVLDQGPLSTTTPGTVVACTNGTFYVGGLYVPHTMVLTGATNLIGTTGETDSVIYYLWDQDGTVIAHTALAGVTVGTASTMQTRIPFVDPIWVKGPGLYFAGCIFNGATATFNAHAIGNGPAFSSTGVFGTNASLTTALTFTADKAPVMGTY